MLQNQPPAAHSDAAASAALDRKVRRLIARKGPAIALADAFKLCPYRTLLGFHRPPHDPLTPGHVDQATQFVAVLGFVAEDFSERMRNDVLAELRRGSVVLLGSNRAELRDHAKREILLALSLPAGAA